MRAMVPTTAESTLGLPASEDVTDWLDEHARRHALTVSPRPISELHGWHRDPKGNLVHRSGRFFSLRGVRTCNQDLPSLDHVQPILLQRDIGILGVLRASFYGVPHYLMQAKIEPGNPGQVQVSPTVQATRSNYTAAHRGSAVPYLDHFHPLPSGRVVVDSLQPEHEAVFFKKYNRNMVVEVSNNIPVEPGFRWMRLEEIANLLQVDHVINMDSRSVMSLLPSSTDLGPTLYEDSEIRSWLTRQKAADLYVSEIVDLDHIGDTSASPTPEDDVLDYAPAPFRVLGIEVRGGGREVASWHQPIVELRGSRVETMVTATFRGQPHLLIRAARHHGTGQGIELHPTRSDVDGAPDPWALTLPPDPVRTTGVLAIDRSEMIWDVDLSEEGGRFHHASSRYRILKLADADPREPGPEYRWVTPGQLLDLTEHGGCVSVQARSFLAAIMTGAVAL